jgi:hypothetical protein
MVARISDNGGWMIDPTFRQALIALGLPELMGPMLFPFPEKDAGGGAEYHLITDSGLSLIAYYIPAEDSLWEKSDAWNDDDLLVAADFIVRRMKLWLLGDRAQ